MKPGYKHTEVGVVPEEWESSTIDRVFQFKQGVQCPIEEQSKVGREGYKRFIRIIDLTNPEEGWRYIADPGITHHVTPSELFMVRYGSPGLIGFGYEGVVANNLFRLLPKRKVDGRFYHQYLAGRQTDIASLSGSSTMPAVTFSTLSLLHVVYPPLPEQRAIAETLSDVDALLGGLDRLIAKKRDLKQAAMQQLLTGQTRLSNFNTNWKTQWLGHLTEKLAKTNRPASAGKQKGKFPFFTSSTGPCERFLDEADFNGEAIIANTGGLAFFNFHNGPFAASCHCLVLRSLIETRFLFQLLKMSESRINAQCFVGSGLKVLDRTSFEELEVLVPENREEQTAIAAVLTDMDAELAALEQRRAKTRALKQGMMQELLTGRTRLVTN